MPPSSRSASTSSGVAFFTPIRTKRDHLLLSGLPGLAPRRGRLYGNGALNLSVVIPTLNEEASLGRLLDRLRLAPGDHEGVVSDGGASRGTAALAPPPNEEAPPRPLLHRLRLAPGVHEVVVSDGGSSDGTVALVLPPHRLVR